MSPESAVESVRLAPAGLFAAVTLPVLGIPVRFETNSPGVIAAAHHAFGHARGDAKSAAAGGLVRVRIKVRGGRDEGSRTITHTIVRPDVLWIDADESRAVADSNRCEAVASVTHALVRDELRFRREVLKAATLFIVTRNGRLPLHAGGVMRGDAALLLAGPGGAGKSTTCYAALRSGLGLLSEDAVFIQDEPFTVWGGPRRLHLTPEAARFFPELRGRQPELLPNGKHKLMIDVAAAGRAWPSVSRAGLCILQRGGVPGIHPISPRDAVAALTAALDPGFDDFAATAAARIRRVAEGGAWRLTLPPHPSDVIPLLHQMLDTLES